MVSGSRWGVGGEMKRRQRKKPTDTPKQPNIKAKVPDFIC
jgi:hypothetical protein